MKFKHLFKFTYVVLLLLLLTAVMITPAVAQEPEEDGKVEIQVSFHNGFGFNPVGTFITPQIVESGQYATTDFIIDDVEDLYGVNVAFDFNPAFVTVADIQAGSLFDGLTEGVQYIVNTTGPVAVPLNGAEPFVIDSGASSSSIVPQKSLPPPPTSVNNLTRVPSGADRYTSRSAS